MNLTRRGFVGALIGLGAAPSLILPAAAKAEQRVQTATITSGGRIIMYRVKGTQSQSVIGSKARLMRPTGETLRLDYIEPGFWAQVFFSPGNEPIFTATHPLIIYASACAQVDVAWEGFDGGRHARSTQDGTLLLQ